MSADGTAWTRNDSRISALIGCGHFLSHFYILCLPPLFLAWRDAFDVSYAELGLSVALMSGVTAALQTPVGFLVDRHGARPFLVGGTLLMALSVAAMGLATEYWQILVLAVLSGVGNSVIHPADYAILAGSIGKGRMGRAFAVHTFTGNLGFALAPPVIALLMVALGWRGALLLVGLVGVPVVAAILWQSRILRDQPKARGEHAGISGADLLTSRTMLGFFAFFLLSAMAGAGIMTWLVTVLTKTQGLGIEAASTALTAYMVGATGGVLVGGWISDRTTRHLPMVIGLTIAAAVLVVATGALPLGEVGAALVIFGAGLLLGTSRTPRDVMVKDAAPPGQVGKVFGFVSGGLPLGQAITPVPFGALIDWGFPALVLPLAAALMLASLLFAGGARAAGPMRVEGRAVAAE
jgi:MFS family permease